MADEYWEILRYAIGVNFCFLYAGVYFGENILVSYYDHCYRLEDVFYYIFAGENISLSLSNAIDNWLRAIDLRDDLSLFELILLVL